MAGQKLKLFGGDREESIASNLLDEILSKQPLEKVIELLSEAIKKYWAWDKGIILLAALERATGEDKIVFREHLMVLYRELPSEDNRWTEKDPSRLKIEMLKKILEGWSEREGILGKDAERCFSFICQAWGELGSPYLTKKFRKDILDIFRERFERYYYPRDLAFWICRKKTPASIAQVILYAMLHAWPGEEYKVCLPLRAELQIAEHFGLRQRSLDAVELVKNYMRTVRTADELTAKLTELIRPIREDGKPNEKSPVKSGTVFCHLESADIVRFRVKLVYKKGVADNPDTVFSGVQAVRDELIGAIKYSPKILIKIENPDGGVAWEEED